MSNLNFPAYVQGSFRLKGTSLTAWARKNRLNVKTVHAAVHGTRQGTKSRAIVARIRRALVA